MDMVLMLLIIQEYKVDGSLNLLLDNNFNLLNLRKDYEKVIVASNEAFKEWRMIPAPIRGQLILEMANELRNKNSIQDSEIVEAVLDKAGVDIEVGVNGMVCSFCAQGMTRSFGGPS